MNHFAGAMERTDMRCPHCGLPIQEIQLRKFQVYEMRVASWLGGEVPPIGEPDFDVWNCKAFPSLTFQIKYSQLGVTRRGGHMNGQRLWTWNHHKLRADRPDYFVLCGLSDGDGEEWFLIPRRAFIAHASDNGKGGYIMQGQATRFSRRGQSRKSAGYLWENTIWKYHCADPAKMIVDVLRQEELYQLSLL